MTVTETPASIHRFWFGENAAALDDAGIGHAQAKLWWAKHSGVDEDIRIRFAGLMTDAAEGRLDSWADTPDGLLALILLTDQFPRNAWRDSARAFASDEAARRFCRTGLSRGCDTRLRPIERVFFYLPLEHSESLEDQEQSVRLFEALKSAVSEDQKDSFEGYLDFARRHRDIIVRFGRYPHRNALLGRASTPEELAFLGQRGSRF